jgi:hypothetical protein
MGTISIASSLELRDNCISGSGLLNPGGSVVSPYHHGK